MQLKRDFDASVSTSVGWRQAPCSHACGDKLLDILLHAVTAPVSSVRPALQPQTGQRPVTVWHTPLLLQLMPGSALLQDHFFQPVLGQMVKLVFLSSGVHQIVFSIKSTLPFAVGQVQDVGLIFLSAMASSVVDACHKAGKNSDVTLGTVLVTLLLTTLLVGILIIVTGKPVTKLLSKVLFTTA